MFLFNKTAVLDIENVGQIKFSEEEGFIPFVKAKTTHNKKVVRSFFADLPLAGVGFSYHKMLGTASLMFVDGKKK